MHHSRILSFYFQHSRPLRKRCQAGKGTKVRPTRRSRPWLQMEARIGLRTVHIPEPDIAHIVDIVSVHDLQDRDATCRLGAQRFTEFLSHDIPAARIFSFGYDRSQSVHDSATGLFLGLTQVWEDSRTVCTCPDHDRSIAYSLPDSPTEHIFDIRSP